MNYENDISNMPLSISPGDMQRISTVQQLLECRARLNDSKINNRLLHELVFKYSALERKLKALNRELTVKQDRIEQDLAAAAHIQRSLLPKGLDSQEGLKIAWKFKPCEKIGGDIFNLIQLDTENWAIYIIDVAGHGVPAAMVAVSVFQYERLKELKDQPVERLIETVFKSLMAFGNNTAPKDDISLLGVEFDQPDG